jgi:hypothetical protein
VNAPGVTRTRGQQFRKLLLYPSELRGRSTVFTTACNSGLIQFSRIRLPWPPLSGPSAKPIHQQHQAELSDQSGGYANPLDRLPKVSAY